jgi:hypothetical protein
MLAARIPTVSDTALSGSQFSRYVAHMDERERERAIFRELMAGNIPRFLRNLIPVELHYRPANGKEVSATVFVTPDYLAIGSNHDFLRIPMNLYTAAGVASRMGFSLPTRKIVDAIYSQSAFHFTPEPMVPGPSMRSTDYYRIHNEKIESQSRSHLIEQGTLVAGDKKDVVLTPRLAANPGKIAIYGWHRATGMPIQPLSTVHGACYADYSHGIRFVSETMLVNGEPHSLYDVLRDEVLSRLLSDEGPIPGAREFLSHTAAGDSSCGPI